ncbi:MAG: hypothetical protein ABIK19_04395 [candidate division WOR-3 bacterium]
MSIFLSLQLKIAKLKKFIFVYEILSLVTPFYQKISLYIIYGVEKEMKDNIQRYGNGASRDSTQGVSLRLKIVLRTKNSIDFRLKP